MRNEIVVLSRSLPMHGFGGMEIVTWDLSRELARRGILVTIMTTPVPDGRNVFEQDGVHVVTMEGASPGRYSKAWWLQSRSYFESHYMQSAAAVLSVSAAGFGLLSLKERLPGVPFILQAHGTSWGEILSKWTSRRLLPVLSSVRNMASLPRDLLTYRKFDAVVAVGERVRWDLLRAPVKWLLPSFKVHLINNGIDASQFQPSVERRREVRRRMNIGEQTPVIISASRLHKQKGIDTGLRAFAKILRQRPEALYVIAGEGPDGKRLQTLSGQLGVSSHVRFLGSLTRDEMVELLQAADLLLFLTKHVEGMPLNILEALSSGLPVVASDHLRIFDSPLLYRVAASDVTSASSLILSVLESRPNRTKGIPNEYVLSACAEKYQKLIAEISKRLTTH